MKKTQIEKKGEKAAPEVVAENLTAGKNISRSNNLHKQERSKSSYEALMASAMHLFWEKGYAETSLVDVVKHAGVHSGSMYYNFKTKEELLLAVLDRYLETLQPVLLAPVYEKFSDPIERVFGLLGRYREAIVGTEFGYGCPIGRLALEISPAMAEVHKKIAANFEGWSGAVRENLEAAGNRLPRGVDLTMLSRFVLTVMEGGVMQSRAYGSVEPFDQAVAMLRDYFKKLETQAVAEGGSYWKTVKK